MAKAKVYKVCTECNIKKKVKTDFLNATKDICLECAKKIKKEKRVNTYAQRKEDVTKTKNFTGFYIYRFLDKDDNIIYVGKTTNFDKRMEVHFGKVNYHDVLLVDESEPCSFETNKESSYQLLMHHGHLEGECYESVRNVEKMTLNNQYEMDILEIHFINKFRPEYNTEFKYNNVTDLFDICEPKWLRTISLINLKIHFIRLNGNTKLYDKILGSDEMVDIVARNKFKSQEELIEMCNNIK